MRIKKYLSPAGALNKRYTDKDFEGTGWHYIPRSDIKPDDKLLDTALKLGEEYYLAGEDGYLLPSNTVNDFLKSKGLTTAYDYYYDQLNLSPFTKNLNNYFTLQYDANDRIGQLMKLRAADRKANRLTPGAGTFVVAPVAATLAGIGGATLAPWLTSALATPTGQALIYGTLGGELLNGASQLGGYDNFGHLIYNAGGGENWKNLPEWQKTLWNFTNPGYLISGPTSKAVDLTVEGLQRAATNTVKSSIVSDATKTAVNDYIRNMFGIDPSLLAYTIKSETTPYILPYYMNRALNTNMPKPKGYKEYKIPGIVIDLINENLAGTTYRTQKDIDKVNQILKNIKYRLWDSERGYADNVDKYSYGVFDNSPLIGRYGRIQISGGLLGRDNRRVLRHEVDHLVDLTITGTSKEYRKMLKEAFPEVQEIERNQLKGDIRDVILQEHNLNNASDEARRDFILSRKLLSDEELAEYITTVGYGNEIPRSALTPHRLTQIRRLLAGYNVYPLVKLPPKSNIINGVKTEMREIPNQIGLRQTLIGYNASDNPYAYSDIAPLGIRDWFYNTGHSQRIPKSNLTWGERHGFPKGERNIKYKPNPFAGTPSDTGMTIFHRTDAPLSTMIDGQGNIVFKAGKSLRGTEEGMWTPTSHWTTDQPVLSHQSSIWEGMPTTIAYPMDDAIAINGTPLNIEPMDTYWAAPDNFRINSQKAKILTSNAMEYMRLKQLGVDVEFTTEGRNLQQQLGRTPTYSTDDYIASLSGDKQARHRVRLIDKVRKYLSKENDTVHREWAAQQGERPTIESYHTLEETTGKNSGVKPKDPRGVRNINLESSNIDYQQAPATHSNSYARALEEIASGEGAAEEKIAQAEKILEQHMVQDPANTTLNQWLHDAFVARVQGKPETQLSHKYLIGTN